MISFNACMEACKRAGHWELALCLYDMMTEAVIEADAERNAHLAYPSRMMHSRKPMFLSTSPNMS